MDDVGGRYELLAQVGDGAMSTVYRARDHDTGRLVAYKQIGVVQEHAASRFRREAELLSQLDHESIVDYVDHGVDVEGNAYLVMEWVEGETLGSRFGRGPLTTDEVCVLGTRLAGALGAVHERGAVHRDLKPANVVLADGRVDRAKLLDFGVAHMSLSTHALTRTGTIIGTPEYMSPEQARGERIVGPTADVFSLGAILYEALGGVRPFTGKRIVAVLAKVLFEDPEPLETLAPDAPVELTDLIHQMLAKDASLRPSDGAAVASALVSLHQRPASQRPPPSMVPGAIGLGGTERTVLTVVLATHRIDYTQEAPTAADPKPQVHELEQTAARLGLQVHPVADGGLIATVERGASATERAAAACRCALRIRDALPELTIAVVTGRGWVRERMPVGAVIDGAAELLSDPRVQPGMIRIDESTAGLLDARFELSGGGDLLLVESERRPDANVRRFLGMETPFVGRRFELRFLEDTFEQCVDESTARAVLVTGPAGYGKSRLRYELVRRLEAEESVTAFTGWGDPIRQGAPLGLLAEALRREMGVRDGEDVGLSRSRVRGRVARTFGDDDEYRQTAVFLGELMGVPFDGDEHELSSLLPPARRNAALMAERMRDAFLGFLRAECRTRPVVLVLEDLHWADEMSIEYVDAALGAARELPLFVLALCRPESAQHALEAWSERHVEELPLRELSNKASAKLAQRVLGNDVSGATIERLVDLAHGNAFFLEELIRAVVEGEVTLPESVAAMVQTRFSAMDAERRRTLRAASIFGEVCWKGGVKALLGDVDEDELERSLEELVRREAVSVREPSRFPGDQELVFRHSLVRETAYEALTEEDRRLGHAIAGRWLRDAGERSPIILAEHFDRGGESARAAEYYAQAAAQALAASDIEGAGRRARRGLALAGSPAGETPDVEEARRRRGVVHGGRAAERSEGDAHTANGLGLLHLVSAEVARWRGEHREAAEQATLAAFEFERGESAWFAAMHEALSAASRLGDHDRAEALAKEAEEVEGRRDTASAQVVCLCTAARLLFHAGRYESAAARIEAAEALADEHRDALDPSADAELHRVAAARARQFGDPQADADGYAAALASYERASDARNACNTRVSLGFALVELGSLEEGERELRLALSDAERMGLAPIATRARHNLGLALCELGRLDEAREIEQGALEAAIARADSRLEGGCRMYLSMIAYADGRMKDAEAEARGALRCFTGMIPAHAGARAALARALLQQGRLAEAMPLAAEANETLTALGGIEEYETLIRVACAEVLAAGDQRAPAKAVLKAARTRLLERASAVSTDDGRARFLERDSDNRRLLELCGELEVGDAG